MSEADKNGLDEETMQQLEESLGKETLTRQLSIQNPVELLKSKSVDDSGKKQDLALKQNATAKGRFVSELICFGDSETVSRKKGARGSGIGYRGFGLWNEGEKSFLRVQ